MKHIVVAYDERGGIGARNDLLWGRDLPSDLAHFKELTMGGSLIMGRKTFASIGRALPGRETIVMTRQSIDALDVIAVSSLERAFRVAKNEPFVVGGGQAYEQALPLVDVVHATEVHAVFPGADTFFPQLQPELWEEVSREAHVADDRNVYDYDFVTYQRRGE